MDVDIGVVFVEEDDRVGEDDGYRAVKFEYLVNVAKPDGREWGVGAETSDRDFLVVDCDVVLFEYVVDEQPDVELFDRVGRTIVFPIDVVDCLFGNHADERGKRLTFWGMNVGRIKNECFFRMNVFMIIYQQ